MSRIVEINSVAFGSTGNIMMMAAEAARKRGHEVITICPKSRSNQNAVLKPDIMFGSIIRRNIGSQLAYYTGYSGCFSIFDTKCLIKKIKRFNPDIIHLHNLHSEYINIPMLFDYIKQSHIRTVMTLHDCWTMTGGCAHFALQNCNKWKTGCFDCRIYRDYPTSWKDNTRKMYALKKKWFTSVEKLDVITPSNWLGDVVKHSFMGSYPIHVIHTGINLDVFKPTESDFRKCNGIEDKKIVLGVAFGWGYKKGLDVFVKLAEELTNDYQIVLVGTDDIVDNQLPANIISIHRTENQQELSKIYSAADVFVNPTREEVLGLVNIEALACGTPVITFRAGGSPECVDKSCGVVVDIDDINGMRNSIMTICKDRPFSSESCQTFAIHFDQQKVFNQYVDVYEE